MTLLMLSRLQWEMHQAQWSDLRGDDTFGFSYRNCNWRCDRDDITHSIRIAGA